MRKLLFICVSILFFCGSLAAQAECPKIDIKGPSGVTQPGDSMTFTAAIEPARQDLKYEWSVSDGKIIDGQGTTAIKVETPKNREVNVTATITITGFPAGCPKYASETASVPICYTPELLDEFQGPVSTKDELRFKWVEITLRNRPDFRALVVLYYKSVRQREADKRKILKYVHPLVKARISFVDGPDRGDGGSVKVWLVPAGAEDPEI